MATDLSPLFHPVDPLTWERKPWFDYYDRTIKCKYTLNADVDITRLLACVHDRGLKFFPVFLYVVLRAVNRNREFRMGYDANGVLGYWDYVVPSYTIFHEDDHTFSDIWSEYSDEFPVFYKTVCADMQTYRDVKGVKARPGRPDNYCPVSALPWLSFTGFSQDTYSESSMLFPLVRFGKYRSVAGSGMMLPVAVFVNHAVADGYHTCKLINDMQEFASDAPQWLRL